MRLGKAQSRKGRKEKVAGKTKPYGFASPRESHRIEKALTLTPDRAFPLWATGALCCALAQGFFQSASGFERKDHLVHRWWSNAEVSGGRSPPAVSRESFRNNK